MKIFLIILTAFVGNVFGQESAMDTSHIGKDKSKEQVITLTKEKLALKIENKKLQNSISDLKQTLAELTKEKLEVEKDLSSLEKEIVAVEKKLDATETKNQHLQRIVDQVNLSLKTP